MQFGIEIINKSYYFWLLITHGPFSNFQPKLSVHVNMDFGEESWNGRYMQKTNYEIFLFI